MLIAQSCVVITRSSIAYFEYGNALTNVDHMSDLGQTKVTDNSLSWTSYGVSVMSDGKMTMVLNNWNEY